MTGIRLIAASKAAAVRASGGRTALLITSEQDSSSIRRVFAIVRLQMPDATRKTHR